MTSFLISALLIVAFSLFMLWPFLAPLMDSAAARTASLKERTVRVGADLKSAVVQKARAGARLVALLGNVMWAFLLAVGVAFPVVVGVALGYIAVPFVYLKRLLWDTAKMVAEDATDGLLHSMDKRLSLGVDAWQALTTKE